MVVVGDETQNTLHHLHNCGSRSQNISNAPHLLCSGKMASLFLYQQSSVGILGGQAQVGFRLPHWHTEPIRVEVPLVGKANGNIKVGHLHPGSMVNGLFPTGSTCRFYVAAVYFCERSRGDPMVLLTTSCEGYLSDYSLAVVVPRHGYLYCGERRFYIHYEIRADAQSHALYSSCTPRRQHPKLHRSQQGLAVFVRFWQ